MNVSIIELAEREILLINYQSSIGFDYQGTGLTIRDVMNARVILYEYDVGPKEILLRPKKNRFRHIDDTESYAVLLGEFPSTTVRHVSRRTIDINQDEECISIANSEDMVLFRIKYSCGAFEHSL